MRTHRRKPALVPAYLLLQKKNRKYPVLVVETEIYPCHKVTGIVAEPGGLLL